MCALKVIVLFHFVVSALLMTSTPSNAKRLRQTFNRKTLMSYRSYINELFTDKSIKRRPRHLAFQNNTPSGTMKVQLYCRTGFLLEIHPNGLIAGTRNVSSEHTIIEVQAFGHILRRLKGVASGRYLSLNHRGRLSSTFNFRQNANTFFNEKYEENYWCSYSSSKTRNCGPWKGNTDEWFIAIKKNGSLKRPCKTAPGMHSTQFIVLRQNHASTHVKENSVGGDDN
ncbi:fibroblast growth factor 2-like isoform X2 [Dendronephthya gigantea]|uniref:fibroblast growth factor 2-like isoform X2 n=1 Tax=Dendronephthya gigantea TaxID=151771 RepID=UPI00106DC349|nr:fibroblast growth factor 2-like isoform X2 [Dendronephthya gigantea]